MWYLQLSKDLGYSPLVHPTRASLLGRKLQIWWQGKGARGVVQGESSGWTSSALEALPAVRVSSVCSIGAVEMEQFPAWGSAPAPFGGSREINACPSREQQSHHPPGRPWSRFTGSAHPTSLWKELPRHWETSPCVCPNPRDNKAWLLHPPSQPLYCSADTSQDNPLSHPPPLAPFSRWDLLC